MKSRIRQRLSGASLHDATHSRNGVPVRAFVSLEMQPMELRVYQKSRHDEKLISYALAIACENTTSISVPECAPVLIWNLARLASTSALVSERLTRELSED